MMTKSISGKKKIPYKTRMMPDWKRNNKIALRNFSDSTDLHDVVKLLFVKMLRRKHKDSTRCVIYTEFDPENPNEDFPDIWMRDENKDIYVWEIQRIVTKEWKKKVMEKYESVNFNYIEIKDEMKEWSLNKLKKYLEKWVI